MPNNETLDCEQHGVQPETFVCKHITAAPPGTTVGFVSGEPEDDDDFRDAWCEACHAYLLAHGGDWIDGVANVPGGVDLLCAECYRQRELDAERAGRRLIYRA